MQLHIEATGTSTHNEFNGKTSKFRNVILQVWKFEWYLERVYQIRSIEQRSKPC